MKHNIYLFQTQNLVGFEGMAQAWLPYSVACIWAYANQFDNIKDNFTLKRVYCIKEPIQEILDSLDDPKICGFSSFVWNHNYNLTLAEKIKTKWPNCIVVFGGPHITLDTINNYKFIDSIIESEGELMFKELLDDYLIGALKLVYSKQRIPDLKILPSPYTTDIFDNLISQYPEFTWATVIETNRGCPYHCTFCDWGSVTNSKIYQFSLSRLQQEIEWIKNSSNVTLINIADANFGIFKERDLEVAKIIRTSIDQGPVKYIHASYTKTYNTHLHEIVKILDQPTGFVISFQSHNTDTLKAIKRKNLSEEEVMKLLDHAEKNHITHEQEYILGLPLETKESWYHGMTTLLDTGQHKVFDVFLCSLLPNTELASEESRKKYGLKTVLTPELNNVGPRESENILEYSEIIKETNTLKESELIDCYVFSLILMHSHCAGYSYIVAKVANKSFSISYLDFYSLLEKKLYADPIIGEHLMIIRSMIKDIFDTGSISDPTFKAEGRFDYMSYQFFFKNKDRIFNIAGEVLADLAKCDQEIIANVKELQYSYIFDLGQKSNFEINSNFDPETGKAKKQKYQVSTKLSNAQFFAQWKGSGSFHNLHQNKDLINKIYPILPQPTKLEQIPIDIVV